MNFSPQLIMNAYFNCSECGNRSQAESLVPVVFLLLHVQISEFCPL